MSEFGKCPLCNRETENMTKHHLVPRELGGKETVDICADCHSAIHARYTNRELADKFNSLDLILADNDLTKAFKFLSKQDSSRRFRNKQSNDRKKKGKYG
jgi:hypothetical protein